jgi:IS605 OrfB family transposase
VPKIFGRGFYEIDFENSRVRLRLDDMAEGQYVVYGFKPWPKDYDFQPDRVDVTSVCAHFVGTRARIGFRFVVAHKQSRFRISQDQIDELRSRTYPRASQDQNFLDEVRLRLLESFPCPPADRLRILTVDLGTAGGAASVFAGKELKKSYPLRVVKLDKLYEVNPDPTGKGGDTKGKDGTTKRGLSKDHVAAHLEGLAKASTKITGKRQQLTEINDETAHSTLGSYDMRRLTLHIGWMIRDWVRLNASQIISLAERENIDLIVLESMRGFRAPGYDKLDEDKKRRLAFFAYGAIRRKIAEKAVERGMRVVTVPYLYSSQVCSECGARQENKMEFDKNKRKRKFICESKSCGHTCNSDENAARVLSKVFWGDIRLPVK